MRCGRRELVGQIDYAFQAGRELLAVHKDAAVVAHAVASEVLDGLSTSSLSEPSYGASKPTSKPS